ncbi:uncharacterized protein MKK02DRAFT_28468 [Dioszegia hungarica]|uniref:Uncharacterized protein n=1 Tax=Dioszegia hungarica TaxID=4972 RepID=A0AA38H6U1_9TREE|nr:uncharacterized protein MKK02DRAFT_28468 [Dioszegia hungarica]KAI9633679.1 hypothetical protein MKK02DRAFT_28468 [Dioszegia hungarica]
MSSIQTPPQTPRRVSSHRRAKTLAPSPVRTPLGPRPTLQHSRSSGTLARQFVDTHSTTYAHLYEHEDDGITREKLEAEQRRLEEERRRGREMRERMMRMKLGGEKENVATGSGETKTRAASWRPLSLVAKRQGGGAGHVRSASHQLPSSLLAGPSLRSVSDTPTSLCITHMAHAPSPSRSPAHSTHSQPLRVVIERSDSPYHSEEGQIGNTSVSSDPKSTYSWASSFSGETAELRATATYLRQSLDNSRRVSANIPEGDEAEHNGATETEAQETLDTPDKVKRRRKRIVAIAHTVRQLEGVGSREAEDPNFYGQLVKAWNDRPGFAPVAAPPLHGPPALLPPPNLPPPPPADPYQYPPPMSPAFERHFGSPADPQLYTPAMGYAGPSTAEEVYEYDDQASDFSGEFRSRSFRNSYASALHDLALEGGEGSGQRMTEKAWLKSPMRWSGAWEGWGAKPPTPAAKEEESTIDWTQTPQRPRPNSSRIPRSAPNFSKPLQPIPVAAGTPDKEGWGLGFMSAWWTEPPASSRNLAAASSRPPSGTEDRRQDFQMGEGETRWISTSPTSLSGDAGAVGESSTPGHTNTSMTLSGVSTPSFGMRIHASAERKWARAEIVRRPAATDTAAPPTWLASIPMETGSSGVSIESHRPMATADSNAISVLEPLPTAQLLDPLDIIVPRIGTVRDPAPARGKRSLLGWLGEWVVPLGSDTASPDASPPSSPGRCGDSDGGEGGGEGDDGGEAREGRRTPAETPRPAIDARRDAEPVPRRHADHRATVIHFPSGYAYDQPQSYQPKPDLGFLPNPLFSPAYYPPHTERYLAPGRDAPRPCGRRGARPDEKAVPGVDTSPAAKLRPLFLPMRLERARWRYSTASTVGSNGTALPVYQPEVQGCDAIGPHGGHAKAEEGAHGAAILAGIHHALVLDIWGMASGVRGVSQGCREGGGGVEAKLAGTVAASPRSMGDAEQDSNGHGVAGGSGSGGCRGDCSGDTEGEMIHFGTLGHLSIGQYL